MPVFWDRPPRRDRVYYERDGNGDSRFLARELIRQLNREKQKDEEKKKKDDDKKKDDKKDNVGGNAKDILALLGLLSWLGPVVGLLYIKFLSMLAPAISGAMPH